MTVYALVAVHIILNDTTSVLLALPAGADTEPCQTKFIPVVVLAIRTPVAIRAVAP